MRYNNAMSLTTTVPRKTRQNDQERPSYPPPLHSGDHLTRAEFERRYAAHPEIKKAELIEGVVYVASPVRIEHGKPHASIMTWLGVYRANTPGLGIGDNATLKLDRENEYQPDAVLYVEPTQGGQVKIEDGYLSGTPELVVEVAASSAAHDLNQKLRAYQRNGVQEYLVLLVYEQQTRWFQLVEDHYELISPDEDGVLRSQVFPGLHFHSGRFWADDMAGLLQILQEGLATAGHQAFVARLHKEKG
jgi:Uma2 family endonuclease